MVRALGLPLRLSTAIGACALLLGIGWAPQGIGPVLRAEQARAVTPALLAALRSSNELLAVRAALALGRTKQLAAEPPLARHLHDPRAAVRAMAIYGLGLIASGREQDAIASALRDRSGAVRVAALDAADRYAAAKVLSQPDLRVLRAEIEGVLASDRNSLVRGRAAATLVSFEGPGSDAATAAALVRAVAHDSASNVREDAMWCIYRGYAKAAPNRFLVAELRDRDEIVRIEAVHAIGKRADAADAAYVTPLLRDPSWRVQEQASETLRLLRGEPLTQHWTKIPSWVHVPPRVPDPLASRPALARTAVRGGRRAPSVAQVLGDASLWNVRLDPTTAAEMTGPAHGMHPRVRIVTTQGNIYVVLFAEWAPFTVENFLNLANRGYYDGNRWFRIVPDFVVQTGDRNDNGNGDAGYGIRAEENPIPQESYVISMGLNYTSGANAHAIRDSAGAQYYITLSPQLHLDRDFTVFGRVTSGFGVLGRLSESDRVLRIERVAGQRL
ncbi:MAG: peptidylprolyl isomerase [Candidatus Tyrphobacter sp.]